MEVDERRNPERAGNPEKADIGPDARSRTARPLAYGACTYQGQPRSYVVEVWVDQSSPDVHKRREDLARFIATYLPAA
ncbi:hypothetical protein [Streptomyces goshikiensis]|uniref:hypothetical protein n=1 Tax=Streptomyces goshikiensis TaxID=1942 RepID=UPI00368C65A8